MKAKILSGKEIALKIESELVREVSLKKEKLGRKPHLASVIAGEDKSARVYLQSQAKTAEKLGIEFELKELKESILQSEIENTIKELSQDTAIDGILIQMPLPKRLNPQKVINNLNPRKDAEGIHPQNLGRLFFPEPKIVPPTAASVMTFLAETKTDLLGKEVVIVGHSEIIGKPLAMLLLNKLATVSVCHIGTSQAGKLKEYLKRAEILIVAVGKAEFIKGEDLKDDVIVIDVGINRKEGRLTGDVDFETACEKASYITPVPGGVGSLTPFMLMRNLLALGET